MGTSKVGFRYRQLGYGFWHGDSWLAVWLDAESITAGNLSIVQFPTSEAIPYYGTIYRSLVDMMDALEGGVIAK